MSISRFLGAIAVMGIIIAGGWALNTGAPITGVGGFVSSAEARVGRPLTPVSVAGVARRTTRRCAAGVYDC